MVQPKHHNKSKPKKLHTVKKQGKLDDISQIRAQLDALGLKIIQVTSDGNCFFRALAEQLEGSEDEHEKYRNMVVQYIQEHRELYEPFIEDEVPFDDYCQSMEKDGTWAGHMELQAASLVTHSNICIHRNLSPRWYIRNFGDNGARMIHLSYHNEEHYNSVRLKEDPCDGPARPIIIKADADLSTTTSQAKVAISKPKGRSGKDTISAGSIKLIMAGSGCENAGEAEQVLLQVDGDVDAAIEYLIAQQQTEEHLAEKDVHTCYTRTSYDDLETRNHEHLEKEPGNKTYLQGSLSVGAKHKHEKNSSKLDEKKISRNKLCPCGSKKKYKACCGTVAGRSSTKLVVNQKVESNKGRKEKRQGKKGGHVSSCEHDVGLVDMGALCI